MEVSDDLREDSLRRRAVRIPSSCALSSDQRSMNGIMAGSSSDEFGSKEKEGHSHVPRMKQG